MAQCPTQAGRYIEETSNAGELLNLLKKRAVSMDKAREAAPAEMAGKFIVGTLHHLTGKREFSQAIYDSFPHEKNH
jgi:2-oxoglutarate ferredoxin oxidoreductase subunit beta